MGENGKQWEKWLKVGKSEKKVGKSAEKWGEWRKMAKNGEKLQRVSGKKWGKVEKSLEKCKKCG